MAAIVIARTSTGYSLAFLGGHPLRVDRSLPSATVFASGGGFLVSYREGGSVRVRRSASTDVNSVLARVEGWMRRMGVAERSEGAVVSLR